MESREVCYHIESAVTDANGEFKISFTAEGINVKHVPYRTFNVYKPGYKTATSRPKPGSGNYGLLILENNDVPYLVKGSKEKEQRMKEIEPIASAYTCHDSGKSGRNLYILYKALYEEVRKLAISKSDFKIVKWIQRIAADYALSEDKEIPFREYEKRIDKFIHENFE